MIYENTVTDVTGMRRDEIFALIGKNVGHAEGRRASEVFSEVLYQAADGGDDHKASGPVAAKA